MIDHDHIRPRKLWQFLNFKTRLTQEEEAHLAECAACFAMFRRCGQAGEPDEIEDDCRSREQAA